MGKVASALTLVLMTSYSVATIVTSSWRLRLLPEVESELMDRLEVFLKHRPHHFSNVLSLKRLVRTRRTALRAVRGKGGNSLHPNAVYLHLSVFHRYWLRMLDTNPELSRDTVDLKSLLPTTADLHGAGLAIARLQQVYNITPQAAFLGNYSGFLGPVLHSWHPYQLAVSLLENGYVGEAEGWLTVARREEEASAGHVGWTAHSRRSVAQILGLLGQRRLGKGDRLEASALYEQGNKIDAWAPELLSLRDRLTHSNKSENVENETDPQGFDTVIAKLCARNQSQRVPRLLAYHICRYHSGLYPPYFRYKEEILSTSPYVTMFYDVMSHKEVSYLVRISRHKLQESKLSKEELNKNFIYRCASGVWQYDDQPVTRRLSSRIHALTGLRVQVSVAANGSLQPNTSAEHFQVVNYGLGGHYVFHPDSSPGPWGTDQYFSKARLATFMVYLTNVERGGQTVFPHLDLSVAPCKGAALLWYNHEPLVWRHPELAFHAACPVLRGHKWIVTKWILFHDNFLRRPCGLRPSASHLDVERFCSTAADVTWPTPVSLQPQICD